MIRRRVSVPLAKVNPQPEGERLARASLNLPQG